MNTSDQQAANKALVIEAISSVFIRRDESAPARFFSDDYLQRNPGIPTGSAALPALIASLPSDFRYELGMVIAEGDRVMVHGRYTGWGPKPMVAVDIFRVENGRVAEHWDVMQEEVPADRTVSGNAMFTQS